MLIAIWRIGHRGKIEQGISSQETIIIGEERKNCNFGSADEMFRFMEGMLYSVFPLLILQKLLTSQ